ncbi:terpene cyclase/mutase family protein [Verrucomicrobiaceae bacterium N1E253]|uniref:Terpene cyclase/mutase family protein n=1 Tax=Oceaniferula marina TaxID=2748318 RepID=A0A851GKG9_9BACT|nr:prenyltransferase/squalene oxidase repeat-containing protein [Oceaniferula marina]NWK57522.1 terpene cyclase/mutase family protein [Oceaniferula marina]
MLRTFAILVLLGSSLMANPDLESAMTKGVDFLVGHQNKDGSWGGPTRTKGLNIFAPLPDGHQAFHTASSALALHGLLESRDQRPDTLKSIARGEQWLLEVLPKTRSINPKATYNIWAHAYGLRALASLYRYHDDPEKRKVYKEQALTQIAKLKRYEDINGGFGYLDFKQNTVRPSGMPTSFTTATALLGMHDAASTMDLELPPRLIKTCIRCIQEQRNADFTYVYAREHRRRPRLPINRAAGSLGRSQVCNAALRKFDDTAVTDDVIRTFLQRLVDRQGWLDHGRKRPVPHEAPAAVAGYFYYYGHYYASECIHILPKEEQGPWKEKLAAILIPKQEKNGSWWDYPLYNYHYAYGTGYMLSTLARCR